jgi:mRNA-degrading endonuclease YafQ of YafQ-DinJ toxin-antitoxin module
MVHLVFRPSFDRAYARYTKRNPARRERVDRALGRLERDPNDSRLKTHPLKGARAGQLACHCGYDCRIVFIMETDPKTRIQSVILLDVGTHDEVY